MHAAAVRMKAPFEHNFPPCMYLHTRSIEGRSVVLQTALLLPWELPWPAVLQSHVWRSLRRAHPGLAGTVSRRPRC